MDILEQSRFKPTTNPLGETEPSFIETDDISRKRSLVQVQYRPPYCTVDRTLTFSSDIPLGGNGMV